MVNRVQTCPGRLASRRARAFFIRIAAPIGIATYVLATAGCAGRKPVPAGPVQAPANAARLPVAPHRPDEKPASLTDTLLPATPSFSLNGAVPPRQVNVNDLKVNIAKLEERVKAHPEDVSSRVALLTQLDAAGRTSEAEDLIRLALQRGQRHPKLYHALGMLYMQHKQYDAAAEEFFCEVKVAPSDPDANLRLAECYSLIGQRERAAVYFQKTLKLKPSEPDAYIGLAYLNSSTQRSPYAIQYLQKYVKLSKDPGQGYLLLSRIFVNQDRSKEAIDAGLKGVATMPGNAEMWYNLGQAYAYSRGTNLQPKAEEAFLKVTQLTPNNGHGHFELGRLYTRMGRIPEAVVQYAEAVRCEPMSGRYRYQYGRSLVQAHRTEESARELARSKELLPLNQREDHLKDRLSAVPNDANAWLELAKIYKQYGSIELARACSEKALKLSPGLASARELQRDLATATSAPARRP